MALVTSNKMSRVTLRDTLYPLFILYVVSYVLLFQQLVSPTSQVLLFIKLLLGAFILGVPSWYILKNKSAFKVALLPARINWPLALYAVLLGVFLLYGFFSLQLIFPTPYVSFLFYYGYFNPHTFLYYGVLSSLALYVLTEELFFRGVVYQYVRGKFGIIGAALLTAPLFALAHLNFQISFVIILLLLSFITTGLLEYSGTFLYGFLAHATLDMLGLLIITYRINDFLYNDIFLRALVFGLAAVVFGWLLFVSPWSKKLLS